MKLPRVERSELLLRIVFVALAASTIVVAFMPAIHGHIVAPALDLVLDTVAVVISGSVAVLAWVRFRERREPIAAFQAAAFLPLTIAYVAAISVTVARDAANGARPVVAGEQEYVFALARVLTAVLLVAAGVPIVARAGIRRPFVLITAPAVLMVVTVWLLYGQGLPGLPALVTAGLNDPAGLPTITPFGTALQLVVATLFLAAAWSMRRLRRRSGSIADAYVALGLLFAGFAEIHWILYPSSHPAQVSTADILRLAWFASLFLGIEAEARDMLARLRRANAQLARLRDADVERAELEERARLARELHDGVAQDLWLAKLKTTEAASMELPVPAGQLLAEAGAAIENGLVEARQAVMALRMAASAGNSFGDLMTQYVEDFEDRFGLRVELDVSGDASALNPRTRAELLRIAQEALVNVRQHADATVVRVRFAVQDGCVTLGVVDNGCGFDPTRTGADSYGLSSMRERALLVGGRLEIASKPGGGTRITLVVPIDPTALATRE